MYTIDCVHFFAYWIQIFVLYAISVEHIKYQQANYDWHPVEMGKFLEKKQQLIKMIIINNPVAQ